MKNLEEKLLVLQGVLQFVTCILGPGKTHVSRINTGLKNDIRQVEDLLYEIRVNGIL